uniref:Ribosomal_L2_C domain-containing protein n=1 Tax=Ascaris lumbricoides TaxID=6252 RepID=A0A0M3I4I5_ASCLU
MEKKSLDRQSMRRATARTAWGEPVECMEPTAKPKYECFGMQHYSKTPMGNQNDSMAKTRQVSVTGTHKNSGTGLVIGGIRHQRPTSVHGRHTGKPMAPPKHCWTGWIQRDSAIGWTGVRSNALRLIFGPWKRNFWESLSRNMPMALIVVPT